VQRLASSAVQVFCRIRGPPGQRVSRVGEGAARWHSDSEDAVFLVAGCLPAGGAEPVAFPVPASWPYPARRGHRVNSRPGTQAPPGGCLFFSSQPRWLPPLRHRPVPGQGLCGAGVLLPVAAVPPAGGCLAAAVGASLARPASGGCRELAASLPRSRATARGSRTRSMTRREEARSILKWAPRSIATLPNCGAPDVPRRVDCTGRDQHVLADLRMADLAGYPKPCCRPLVRSDECPEGRHFSS